MLSNDHFRDIRRFFSRALKRNASARRSALLWFQPPAFYKERDIPARERFAASGKMCHCVRGFSALV